MIDAIGAAARGLVQEGVDLAVIVLGAEGLSLMRTY